MATKTIDLGQVVGDTGAQLAIRAKLAQLAIEVKLVLLSLEVKLVRLTRRGKDDITTTFSINSEGHLIATYGH